jgi:ABC-type Fe3+ transport system substrate-binding protein
MPMLCGVYILTLVVGTLLGALSPVFGQSSGSFNSLVERSKAEVAKKDGRITVATNWVASQAKPLLEAFKKDYPFVKEAKFQVLRGLETSQRILMEHKAGRAPDIDVSSIPDELWGNFKDAGAFLKPPFSYRDLAKSLPADWPQLDARLIDPEDYFVAVSAGARGIAYNKNLVSTNKAPKRWEDCTDPMWKGKVVYDSRPTLTAFQHNPQTRAWHLKWLEALVANKPILMRARRQSMEKVASGEYALYCGANYSHAMPMVEEGAPVVFFFPDPFPLDLAVALHVTKWSMPATTQLFAVWTATKAQPIVEERGYRGFPWIPGTRIHKIAQGKNMVICDLACSHKSDEYFIEHGKILGLPGLKK